MQIPFKGCSHQPYCFMSGKFSQLHQLHQHCHPVLWWETSWIWNSQSWWCQRSLGMWNAMGRHLEYHFLRIGNAIRSPGGKNLDDLWGKGMYSTSMIKRNIAKNQDRWYMVANATSGAKDTYTWQVLVDLSKLFVPFLFASWSTRYHLLLEQLWTVYFLWMIIVN